MIKNLEIAYEGKVDPELDEAIAEFLHSRGYWHTGSLHTDDNKHRYLYQPEEWERWLDEVSPRAEDNDTNDLG